MAIAEHYAMPSAAAIHRQRDIQRTLGAPVEHLCSQIQQPAGGTVPSAGATAATIHITIGAGQAPAASLVGLQSEVQQPLWLLLLG